MATFIATRQTQPFGAGFNDAPESVVVRAENETAARNEAATILGVPAHDIQVTNMDKVVYP